MRLVHAGDGVKCGEGAVLGATYFEDSPIPGGIFETDSTVTTGITQVDPIPHAEILEISPVTPTIIGAS